MITSGHHSVVVFSSCLFLTIAHSHALHGQEPSFTGMGIFEPDGTGSVAQAVSPDGSVAVGWAYLTTPIGSGGQAALWTAETGLVVNYPSFPIQTYYYGVSNNGAVVGHSSLLYNTYAFWGSGHGGGTLPMPPGAYQGYGMAWAISDDGSVIVGHSLRVGGGHAAIRWDDVAPTILPDLPGTQSNLASDVSGDGMVVVGYCGPVPAAQACRWADGQVFGLGDLPGGSLVSSAGGVSFDGSIIVGVGSSANGIEAFRWENGVMVGLGDLPGGSFSSSAYDVAADGSVIVGRGRADSGDEAFIWDEAHGMRNLRSVLVDLDLDMSGWSLTRAHGISADGLTIVGEGVNPSGMGEGWIAHVPEPTSFLLLGLGLMTLWPRRSA